MSNWKGCKWNFIQWNLYRKLEYNWKNYPEEQTKLGYQDFMNWHYDVIDKNIKLLEENSEVFGVSINPFYDQF